MKITVIIPVYNGETYLENCINSLLNQTYNNIEILIVNDGSTDATAQIAHKLQKEHSNIVLVNKKNAGLPQARKTGIEHATGDYIGFVDVDDWAEPNMFELLLNACEKNHGQIACCGFYWQYVKKKIPSNKNTEECLCITGSEALVYMNTRQKIFPFAWNKLYKKELFTDIHFSFGNFIGEDYDITSQVFSKAAKVIWLSKPLYHYIQLPNSMSRGGYTKDYITAYNNYEKNCNWLSKLYPEHKTYFENYFLTEITSFAVAMGKNNQYNYEMLRNIKNYALTHKKQYIYAKYVAFKYKISVMALCFNYKILINGYKFISWCNRLL